MLYNQRKRIATLEVREGAGESFWSEEFEISLRIKILHLMKNTDQSSRIVSITARKMILEDEGLLYLSNAHYSNLSDFENYVTMAPDEMMPTVIEAWSQSVRIYVSRSGYQNRMNDLLRLYRISFELIDDEMIPFASRELHSEVVAPTLRLLASDESWSPVETAYQNALGEIARGEAANAVTDAGTALQEALILIGAEGNALGPLIKSARRKNILGSHDVPMLDALEKIMNWVSADRSNTGDAHNASPAAAEDAWLIVHVVGAVLLRLSTRVERS